MALIFADDFQQLLPHMIAMPAASTSSNITDCIHASTLMESQGFDMMQLWAYNSSTWLPTVFRRTPQNVLAVRNVPSGFSLYSPGATRLTKTIAYTGDTLFFGFWLSLFPDYPGVGAFIDFDGMYQVGVGANGNYTLNGVDTGEPAYFGNIEIKIFHDIVIGPDYIELYLGGRFIARQERTPLPVRRFSVGFQPSASYWATVSIYSIIVADNTPGGFNSRIGRKSVKTVPAITAGTTESTPSNASYTAIQTIVYPAYARNYENQAPYIRGSLTSPNPYVKNAFNSLKPEGMEVLSAMVNVQAKRRSPSGDGMTAVPYLKIGETITEGARVIPSSLWNVLRCEVPIDTAVDFTVFEFGYTHDYVDTNKAFVDTRNDVRVYGAEFTSLRGSDYLSLPVSMNMFLTKDTYAAYDVPFAAGTVAKVEAQAPTFNGYALDYAATSLIAKQVVENLTYSQDI